eukprot:1788930-Amphidinium_carterae.2
MSAPQSAMASSPQRCGACQVARVFCSLHSGGPLLRTLMINNSYTLSLCLLQEICGVEVMHLRSALVLPFLSRCVVTWFALRLRVLPPRLQRKKMARPRAGAPPHSRPASRICVFKEETCTKLAL